MALPVRISDLLGTGRLSCQPAPMCYCESWICGRKKSHRGPERAQDALSANRIGVQMFKPCRKLFVLPLMLALLFASTVPAVGSCKTKADCRAKGVSCCCCTNAVTSSHPCCTKSAQAHVCRCSVNDGPPATPVQRRSSDERVELASTGHAVPSVRMTTAVGLILLLTDRLHSDFWHSTLRHLAVLCCWQT